MSFIPRFILILSLLLLSVGGLYFWRLSRQPDTDSDQSKTESGLSMTDRKLIDDQLNELQNQLATTREEKASLLEQLDGLNELLSQAYDRLNHLEGRRIDHLYGASPVNYTLTDQKRFRDSVSAQLALMPGKVDQLSEASKQVDQQTSDEQRSIDQQATNPQMMVTASAVTGDKFNANYGISTLIISQLSAIGTRCL